MSISSNYYGRTPEGKDVYLFNMSNINGMTVEITNYGGIVVSLTVPDRNDKFTDVVLGYDKLEHYFINNPYFGAIIGRHANRIEGAELVINNIKYSLHKNDGENHLHGGINGFHKQLWSAEIINKEGKECLRLSYLSKDGEEGYPGYLEVKVTYTLTDNNELVIEYFAVSDKDTVVNLTNHSYFNLMGHSSGSILNHQLKINADSFTVNNYESIPTGEIRSVHGTPLDFTEVTPVGLRIDSDYDQIAYGKGYDHNWILNVSGMSPEKAAELYDDVSGRIMEVFTTMPGMQFYTGNYLSENDCTGKAGARYHKRHGLCLETQYFPNALRYEHFIAPLLKAGQQYKHATIYRFSVDKK